MPDEIATQSDPALLARVRDVAGGVNGRLAFAVVDLEPEPTTRRALIGTSPDTLFEIGSITKALTGMLLAEFVERGRLSLATEVGEVAPIPSGSDLSSVTLLELATHTSGLPRMPASGASSLRSWSHAVLGRNPYRGSPASVIELAARQTLHSRGQRRYSNIGGAALGEILAVVADTAYPSLLAERILRPLQMGRTTVSTKGHHALRGRSSWGLPREPWVLQGYAPAGGVVSTIDDMARLAAALLDGTAPGLRSIEPINGIPTDRPNRRSGLFWMIDGPPDRVPTITWHNGGTGGYSSLLVLVPEARKAVIALQSVAGRSQHLQRIALELAH